MYVHVYLRVIHFNYDMSSLVIILMCVKDKFCSDLCLNKKIKIRLIYLSFQGLHSDTKEFHTLIARSGMLCMDVGYSPQMRVWEQSLSPLNKIIVISHILRSAFV